MEANKMLFLAHKAAIKKAFNASYLPTKLVGMVQPFLFNLRNLAIMLCLALILVSNWYLNKDRVRTELPISLWQTLLLKIL
jgi:hypothetical protein